MADAKKDENKNEDGFDSPKEAPKQAATKDDIEQNKIMGVLAYLGLLVLVPLLAAKESPFAQYHATHGLVLLSAGLIVGAVSGVPIIGWFLVAPLGSIFLLVLGIIGIVNAVQGEMKPLPLIGHFKILK